MSFQLFLPIILIYYCNSLIQFCIKIALSKLETFETVLLIDRNSNCAFF
ncbi:hypothetical protein CAEBREN_30780 [Caenorhabditis brenneri]|uniref:Uncharacterized protein n=1 Tax=Caenorhabditis brenneri TaxID=135651 RepID=G0N704_CAEBE|nr:hypothetical protein CAEBREN_30780 [Caenorhabditis brenneri]